MKKFDLPTTNAPEEISDLLFVAWVQYFAEQRLSTTQHGTGSTEDGSTTYNFGSPTDSNFVLERSLSGKWDLKSAKGIAERDIEAVVTDAKAKLAAGDLGGEIAYQTQLRSPGFDMSTVSMSNFARLLGDQVFITGPRRLGGRVLLDFVPELPKEQGTPQIFTPPTEINVAIFVPGPVASDLTRKNAVGIAEVVGAICALALGKSIELPLMIFPALGADADVAMKRRSDPAILGLARDGISLDIFDEFSALGGLDGLMRVRGWLLSYHAALQQANPDVAMMLLVSAIEALIVPRAEWRKDKATKRFIEAVSELCPAAVDSLVNHQNVEEAFSYKKKGGPKARRRQLLDQIYALRSIPTHSGVGLSGSGMMTVFMNPNSMRVALLSELARGALLSFLQAPRSYLIGHPMFNQPSDT